MSYADRPDRFAGGPVAHHEVRVSGASKLRCIGIETPEDLVGFDPLVPWRRWVRWERPDFAWIGRASLRRGDRKNDSTDYTPAGVRWCRKAATHFGEDDISAQAVRAFSKKFSWFRPEDALIPTRSLFMHTKPRIPPHYPATPDT
ncbi:MAG: hypothetical protein AAF328_01170 [Planctomycetota bacterium]